MQKLNSSIESILFVANKPLTSKAIAKYLSTEENQVADSEVELSLTEIAESRRESGINLIESGGQWQLVTNPANASAVKSVLNSELRERLTDATIETLAIIAYRQPISRGEIEAIRGVNCQYSIRHLLIRGLIQKSSSSKDSRQIQYETTLEFMQHMGLSSLKDLPDFENLVDKIKLPETPSATESSAEPKNTEHNVDIQTDDVQEHPEPVDHTVNFSEDEEIIDINPHSPEKEETPTEPDPETIEALKEQEDEKEEPEDDEDEFDDDEDDDEDDEDEDTK